MVDDVVRQLGHLALGTRLKRLGERLQAETTRFIEASGVALPASWFPLLAAIEQSGGLTVGELAEAVGVSQPGVTRSVGKLADLGLITVVAHDSADRRRRSVQLTAAGVALVARARAEVWPYVEAAVVDAATGLEGSLLDQLDALEARLDGESLDRRAGRLREAARDAGAEAAR